jgi:Arc/MetJ-type ribon-helix-helix transcriptional regulator
MSAEQVQAAEGQDDHLQQMIQLVHALEVHAPADLAKFLASPELSDEARRAVEAVAALQIVDMPHLATELVPLLALRLPGVGVSSPDIVFGHLVAQVKHSGAARKVSVSMPEDLTAAVQRRVGRGKFSQYVTEAVTRQLELDLLSELSELLASEHGPVPEEYLAEARAAWPDDE